MYMDIQSRRKELGLTLEEVGKLVGVGKGTVKKWESGFIKNMRRDKILLLANALQVSPLDILGIPDSQKDMKIASKSRELPLTEDFSSALKKFFGTDSTENTLILSEKGSAVCYTLSPDFLGAIKNFLDSDKI